MRAVLDGLTTVYKDRTLERLRTAVMGSVLPGGTTEDRAARVYAWVLQGDLRCLFPGAAALNGIFTDGPGPIELAAVLDKAVPGAVSLERALPKIGLGPRLVDMVKTYLTSTLPQRRIEGYCALACVCATRRNDDE